MLPANLPLPPRAMASDHRRQSPGSFSSLWRIRLPVPGSARADRPHRSDRANSGVRGMGSRSGRSPPDGGACAALLRRGGHRARLFGQFPSRSCRGPASEFRVRAATRATARRPGPAVVAELPELFAEWRTKLFTLLWRAGTATAAARDSLDNGANFFGGFTPLPWESPNGNAKGIRPSKASY